MALAAPHGSLSDAATGTLIERVCTDVASTLGATVSQFSLAAVGNFPEKITVTLVLEQCLRKIANGRIYAQT